MRLRFTRKAVANITEIGEYVGRQDAAAAARLRASIYDGLERLIMWPKVGRRQKTLGVRKLVLATTGYIIYYAIDEGADEIIVLNVKYPAQRRHYADR